MKENLKMSKKNSQAQKELGSQTSGCIYQITVHTIALYVRIKPTTSPQSSKMSKKNS